MTEKCGEVVIRDAVLTDAERIREIYDHYVRHTAISFEYETPTREEMRERMHRTMTRFPYLAAERDGVVQGYAYAGPFKERAAYDWCCELSIYLAQDARKCGMGRRLYAAMEERLRDMGVLNLYACITCPDREDEYVTRNSMEFHSHLGFRQVAGVPQLRLQVRALVQHDLDGENDRRAPAGSAAGGAVSGDKGRDGPDGARLELMHRPELADAGSAAAPIRRFLWRAARRWMR